MATTKKKTTTKTPETPKTSGRSHGGAPQTTSEGKGPGVIASIAEFLCAASKAKPITKDQLLAKLVKRFPDRGEAQLKTTLNCQLGARIEKGKGIKITRDDDGGVWAVAKK